MILSVCRLKAVVVWRLHNVLMEPGQSQSLNHLRYRVQVGYRSVVGRVLSVKAPFLEKGGVTVAFLKSDGKHPSENDIFARVAMSSANVGQHLLMIDVGT